MTDPRLVVAVVVVLALGPASPAADGKKPPASPARLDPTRVRLLAEVIRTDPDEKKQRAAIAGLADADPRVYPEVIPTLVEALRKEAAGVRAAAAEVIGRFRATFPRAGAALEAAADSDPSPTVRDAARQALWQYHLNGYRSARVVGAEVSQTEEPPVARPGRPRNLVTAEPPPAAVRPVAATPPPVPTAAPLPPVGPPPGPRVALLPGFFGPRTVLAGSWHSNLTVEPPVAKRPENWFPPTTPAEPPLPPHWPHPVSVGKPPPFVLDLPPVVSDPGPIPGVIPFPDPTPEPPLGKVGAG